MLQVIELRVRLLGLSHDVDQAHQMLDAFEVPRSGKTGSFLTIPERLEYLCEELAKAEARQTAVIEAARAYRVSKEHHYRSNDDSSVSHIQMAELALLKAVNRLNRQSQNKNRDAVDVLD